MVACACNPSYSGGWGRRIAWTQEAEVAVSWDHTIALQSEQQEGNSVSKKQTNKKNPKHIDQWNRIENSQNSETNPHTYSELIFNIGSKNIHWRKTVSSLNGAGKTGYPNRRMKLDLYLSPYKKIQSDQMW